MQASLENIILIFRDAFIWEYKKNLKKCKILKKKFDYLGKWGRIIIESDKDIIVLDIKKKFVLHVYSFYYQKQRYFY